ncbi:hypothetical protein CR513_22449, partial [Mucuna pruriens]
MAKGMGKLSSWMEVAPAPIIFPTKPSNTPALETITEEAAEENEDDQVSIWSVVPAFCVQTGGFYVCRNAEEVNVAIM